MSKVAQIVDDRAGVLSECIGGPASAGALAGAAASFATEVHKLLVVANSARELAADIERAGATIAAGFDAPCFFQLGAVFRDSADRVICIQVGRIGIGILQQGAARWVLEPDTVDRLLRDRRAPKSAIDQAWGTTRLAIPSNEPSETFNWAEIAADHEPKLFVIGPIGAVDIDRLELQMDAKALAAAVAKEVASIRPFADRPEAFLWSPLHLS